MPAPSVDVLGPDMTVAEAYEQALAATARRGHARDIGFEESRDNLPWRRI
jgi:hypothetical protein